MQFYELKDTVREHLARTTFPTDMLDKALANGRRIVENTGNYYWMIQDAVFITEVNRQVYPIFSGNELPSGGLSTVEVLTFKPNYTLNEPKLPEKLMVQPIWLPGYKEVRAILVKSDTDNGWVDVTVGNIPRNQVDSRFSFDDSGPPSLVIIENFNLYVYPPRPDKRYSLYTYYYGWTSNPKSNLATDELISRFPEALIYASLAWAYELELKDMQGATYWRQLLGGQPTQVGVGGEIAKIKRHNFHRMRQDNMNLTPLQGIGDRGGRSRNFGRSIWLGSN